MLIGHNTQEFGNFDFENNYTVDMSNVKVQSEIEFSNDKSKKQVYKTKILTRDGAREIALNVFKKMGKENDNSLEVEQENLVRFKPIRKNLKGVQLEYQKDSKGYYVPVYKFDVLLNGNKNRIYIKAIK